MGISGRLRGARALAIALAGVALTASCAAGQDAATSQIRPGIDGTQGRIGTILLEGVAIHAPDGMSYAADSSAQLGITLVNNGTSPDTLVSISSPDFTGWGIVDNADATSTTSSSGADTGLTIDAGSAARLGLTGLGGSDTASKRTVVLTNLAGKLFPGDAIPITFRFAKAGSTTLDVPVQLSDTPDDATLAPLSNAPEE